MKLLPTLIILAILVSLGLVVFFKPFSKLDLRQQNELEALETAEVNLTLEPQASQIKAGEETYYSVLVDSHTFNTYITELRFSFDPQVLRILAFEPGDFFQNPDTLFKSIDPKLGVARYSLGSLNPSTGQGIVANIKVEALQSYDSLDAPLRFNQSDTTVGLETADKSKIFTKEETSILFEEKTISILP